MKGADQATDPFDPSVADAAHSLITVSSHIAYTVRSVGYLLILNRRFVPTAVEPCETGYSRPLSGANTGESIGTES